MTAAALAVLFLVAVATTLLASTVLVQFGMRQRAAILAASVATPILLALASLLLRTRMLAAWPGFGTP